MNQQSAKAKLQIPGRKLEESLRWAQTSHIKIGASLLNVAMWEKSQGWRKRGHTGRSRSYATEEAATILYLFLAFPCSIKFNTMSGIPSFCCLLLWMLLVVGDRGRIIFMVWWHHVSHRVKVDITGKWGKASESSNNATSLIMPNEHVSISCEYFCKFQILTGIIFLARSKLQNSPENRTQCHKTEYYIYQCCRNGTALWQADVLVRMFRRKTKLHFFLQKEREKNQLAN